VNKCEKSPFKLRCLWQ